jgi:hypothetical protein
MQTPPRRESERARSAHFAARPVSILRWAWRARGVTRGWSGDTSWATAWSAAGRPRPIRSSAQNDRREIDRSVRPRHYFTHAPSARQTPAVISRMEISRYQGCRRGRMAVRSERPWSWRAVALTTARSGRSDAESGATRRLQVRCGARRRRRVHDVSGAIGVLGPAMSRRTLRLRRSGREHPPGECGIIQRL